MTESNESGKWLNEALFQVEGAVKHKTEVDASLIQGEVLERIAKLDDRQRLVLVELIATRGRENFAKAAEMITGEKLAPGVEYIFSCGIREMILAVVQATSGTEPTCEYCLNPVNPDAEDTCRRATLWVSGPKSQNTRMRRYTGEFAHKACVEEKVEKPDAAQEELIF